jgi:hypothetical protein
LPTISVGTNVRPRPGDRHTLILWGSCLAEAPVSFVGWGSLRLLLQRAEKARKARRISRMTPTKISTAVTAG